MSHIVRRETLASLWKEFPADLHPMLESLLQKFEIWAAIQVGGSPAYLVTSLLPRDRPSDAWIADKDPIGRLYSLPFAPHGFFSRFLVRTLRFCVPAKYWSCGAVLTADGCEALVELKEGTADYEALFSIMVKVSFFFCRLFHYYYFFHFNNREFVLHVCCVKLSSSCTGSCRTGMAI